MKLIQDFGVRALFGTLIILGVFLLCGVGVYKGGLDYEVLLPAVSSWITAVVVFYFKK